MVSSFVLLGAVSCYGQDIGLTFLPNTYNGVANEGEWTIAGVNVLNPVGAFDSVGDVGGGVVGPDASRQAFAYLPGDNPGFMMYTVESVQERFSFAGIVAEHIVLVRYNNGWQAWGNERWNDFGALDSDYIIGSVDLVDPDLVVGSVVAPWLLGAYDPEIGGPAIIDDDQLPPDIGPSDGETGGEPDGQPDQPGEEPTPDDGPS